MASATTILRDAQALLDPEPRTPRNSEPHPHHPTNIGLDDTGSFHRVGRALLEAAASTGRKETASAAVEVFRHALEKTPGDPSLLNALGASLVELARLESHVRALHTLQAAAQEFEAATTAARRASAPRAARVRYDINLAMALWMLGERTEIADRSRRALDILQSLSKELPPSSTHWSHVNDNIANALMALGRTAEAIETYQLALQGRQSAAERARSLNNLGTAYAEQGCFGEACAFYNEALALQPRDRLPIAWARTQHNLASAMLQRALASRRPRQADKLLKQVIKTFQNALQERRRARVPFDWAVTTANLASAFLGLGTHLCTGVVPSDHKAGLDHVRTAIDLYKQSLAELNNADLLKTIDNLGVALRICASISDDKAALAEIHNHELDLLAFAAAHGDPDVVAAIGEISRQPDERHATDAAITTPPNGLAWPTETYAQAHRERKEDIVQFLSRVWLPLIRAGAVDLRTLRVRDRTAAKGIDNLKRKRDPVTGERHKMPPYLDIPTKKELNDRAARAVTAPGDRSARLDWALRTRERRHRLKEKV